MITQKIFERYARNPEAFRNDLNVDVNGAVRRFGDIQDPWQRDDFASLDPGLMYCNGRSTKPARMRAYLERGRGHSKTTDIAVNCCWALAFSTWPIRGHAFAADRDQARLLYQAMQTIIRLNPWLGEILSLEQHRIVNKAAGHPGEGGTLSIEASDVSSSWGILPDLIVVDELTHWKGDGSLWHSIISSAAKRSNCLLLVISNAGFIDSFQWAVRESARNDDAWIFSRLDGPVASWFTPEVLAEQARMLPPVHYARLWLNQWSTGGGDALTEADIDYAFRPDLKPVYFPQLGWRYVCGVDLGVTRDASAAVVLGVRRKTQGESSQGHAAIRYVFSKRWQPVRGQKIDLQQIEDTLMSLHRRFHFRTVAFDPYQAVHLSQRLGLSGVPMVELTPTASNLQKIATALIESFNDRRVELYDDGHLKRELKQLRIEERKSGNGFRLTSPHDQHGHGDTASAFSFALLAASQLASEPTRRLTFGNDGQSFERRQQEFDREQRLLGGSGNNTHELIADLMSHFPLRRTFTPAYSNPDSTKVF